MSYGIILLIRRYFVMIQLKNVSKYYYSKGMIASGISKVNLTFDIGEFVVITGESGSGKTTLLNVISGLDSYEEGEMYIDGKETSHYLASDFEEYRKKYIGNIFQHFNLVNSYTVYQNIELILLINGYSRDEIKRRVPDIIKRVGLEAYTKTKVSKLSGGQKQRVSIARALAKDTDIIVADEPTGNLDSVSAQGIVELLSEIAHDKLVIVVTHNYDQFAAHATRKIKMHDGSVSEDIYIGQEPHHMRGAVKVSGIMSESGHDDKNITAGSKVRLGVRNTFNIFPKFMLLLIVFLFVVFSVTSQYTTFRNQEEEEAKLGYNDYFYNYSEDRVVLKKTDGSAFTEDDFNAINNVDNVKSVSANDIMMDTPIFIEDNDFAYDAFPKSIGEFNAPLVAGRMPEADNEVIFTAIKGNFDTGMLERLLEKSFKISLDGDKEMNVTVVGFAYKTPDSNSFMNYTGELFVTDQLMSTMMTETYNYNSTVKTTINGKEQQYEEGNAFYRIVPNSRVKAGEAVASEEINNFYEKGDAKGKTITVTAENIFYTQSVNLKIADTYNKKTFEKKTGVSDYDSHNGTIYVNQTDYDTLFNKGNFQVSVYVKDVKAMDPTLDALETMGYVTLPLNKTLINMFNELTSIIKVPMTVILILALFFIAYFVIRLILKSRSAYFSILRMLGLARKNIRRILDVEMLLIVNIAYALFIGCIAAVNTGLIDVEYITTLVQYMRVGDYIVLYVVLVVMAYLISGKFARNLFKKTAMGTYREED